MGGDSIWWFIWKNVWIGLSVQMILYFMIAGWGTIKTFLHKTG